MTFERFKDNFKYVYPMRKFMVLLFECGVGFSMLYLIGSILEVGAKLFVLLASY